MGTAYLKYADMTIKAIKELILIKNSKEIRGNMIDCCKFMVSSGTTQEQKYAILLQVQQWYMSAQSQGLQIQPLQRRKAVSGKVEETESGL